MNNIKDTVIYYEGEIIDMLPFFQKRNSNKEEAASIENDKNNENDKINELSLKLEELTKKIEKNNSKKRLGSILQFCTFLILLLSTFGGAFAYLHTQFSNMNDKIDDCLTEEDIADLRESVKGIESWILGDISDLSKIGANERFNTIENNINTINNRLNILPIDITESTALSNLKYTTSMENMVDDILVPLTYGTYLGEDSNGKKYNIGDVVGETILLTYNEDDKEVYFYGQINEKLHWDGHCITNAYNTDGTLYGICESDFNDGNRLNYESFYLSNVKDEWIYTKRTCKKDGNLGVSQRYSFQYNKVKNFTNTNARIYDLLYIEDFSSLNNMTLLTYYSGYTLNGKYNDIYDYNDDKIERQPPYEIIFNPDGTIKILYIGQFVNGEFHDQTGNAQEIVFDSYKNINKYFYYKGTFTNKNRDGKVSSKNYVTQSQIDIILKDMNFDIKLNWYKTDDSL